MSSAAERIPREARPGVRTVVVSGTPLRVAIRPSTGTGPPLLLANGIGTSLEVFQPFVDALDPAIEVIRFDVPGVGGSPLPARPYRFATLARLLRGLLDELGYQAADILGFSWGGELAQQFALCSPRRCRRLVLVATGTGPQTMVPGNPLALAKMLTQRQYLDADYSRRIAASCTEEAREPTRKQFPGSSSRHASARSAVTCTSTPPGWDGPRCRSCRSSASPPWCSRATTTRSSRWSTPGSWPR